MAYEPHMPTSDEIRDRAIVIFNDERVRAGLPLITPEDYELREGNYWLQAQRELMTGIRSQLEQYLANLRGEVAKVEEELGVEKPPPPPERIAELETEVAQRDERIARTGRQLKEAQAQIRELEEKLKAAPPKPPPTPPTALGLTDDDASDLELDAYERVTRAGLRWAEYRNTVRRDVDISREMFKELPRAEAVKRARARLETLLISIARPPPVPPPPLVPPIGARTREYERFGCWVQDCPETVMLDRDLMRRVTTVPVIVAYSPRGTRVDSLLRFPPAFYYSCDRHRLEWFGYANMYDALAYLVAESRSSTRRLMVTEGTLREAGLDDEDLSEVRARIPRWLGRVPT